MKGATIQKEYSASGDAKAPLLRLDVLEEVANVMENHVGVDPPINYKIRTKSAEYSADSLKDLLDSLPDRERMLEFRAVGYRDHRAALRDLSSIHVSVDAKGARISVHSSDQVWTVGSQKTMMDAIELHISRGMRLRLFMPSIAFGIAVVAGVLGPQTLHLKNSVIPLSILILWCSCMYVFISSNISSNKGILKSELHQPLRDMQQVIPIWISSVALICTVISTIIQIFRH
jgi:hypothetical protein